MATASELRLEKAKSDPAYDALVNKVENELIEKLKEYTGLMLPAAPSDEHARALIHDVLVRMSKGE